MIAERAREGLRGAEVLDRSGGCSCVFAVWSPPELYICDFKLTPQKVISTVVQSGSRVP